MKISVIKSWYIKLIPQVALQSTTTTLRFMLFDLGPTRPPDTYRTLSASLYRHYAVIRCGHIKRITIYSTITLRPSCFVFTQIYFLIASMIMGTCNAAISPISFEGFRTVYFMKLLGICNIMPFVVSQYLLSVRGTYYRK